MAKTARKFMCIMLIKTPGEISTNKSRVNMNGSIKHKHGLTHDRLANPLPPISNALPLALVAYRTTLKYF